jgi:hypothetical protein
MIRTLVESVLETGCLSVASEGLIRQVLNMNVYEDSDLEALNVLNEAVNSGQVQREANDNAMMTFPNHDHS